MATHLVNSNIFKAKHWRCAELLIPTQEIGTHLLCLDGKFSSFDHVDTVSAHLQQILSETI